MSAVTMGVIQIEHVSPVGTGITRIAASICWRVGAMFTLSQNRPIGIPVTKKERIVSTAWF